VVHRCVGAGASLQPQPFRRIAPGLAGLVLSFLAGLLALRWLSRWLDHGRWYLFGIYCLVAAIAVWGFA
jgi:undecaprenyl-diphosphatase